MHNTSKHLTQRFCYLHRVCGDPKHRPVVGAGAHKVSGSSGFWVNHSRRCSVAEPSFSRAPRTSLGVRRHNFSGTSDTTDAGLVAAQLCPSARANGIAFRG